MTNEFLQAYADRWMEAGSTPHQAEREIVRTITKIAHNLAFDFRFGFFTLEDAEQQGVMNGLAAIAKGSYDVNRPLGGFMAVHIKNRLHNWKRDNFMRPQKPCSCCEAFGSPAEPCERWIEWNKFNKSKAALARTSHAPEEHNPAERGVSPHAAFFKEVEGFALGLPHHLRNDYLRLKEGVVLSAERTEAVYGVIRARFAEEARDAF